MSKRENSAGRIERSSTTCVTGSCDSCCVLGVARVMTTTTTGEAKLVVRSEDAEVQKMAVLLEAGPEYHKLLRSRKAVDVIASLIRWRFVTWPPTTSIGLTRSSAATWTSLFVSLYCYDARDRYLNGNPQVTAVSTDNINVFKAIATFAAARTHKPFSCGGPSILKRYLTFFPNITICAQDGSTDGFAELKDAMYRTDSLVLVVGTKGNEEAIDEKHPDFGPWLAPVALGLLQTGANLATSTDDECYTAVTKELATFWPTVTWSKVMVVGCARFAIRNGFLDAVREYEYRVTLASATAAAATTAGVSGKGRLP